MGVGECDACHGNHKILPPSTAMIGTAEGAVCIQCHDKGSRGFEVAADLRRTLDGFTSGYSEVEGLLSLARRKGVEVSDAEFSLQDVHTTLVSAENLTHGLDEAEIAKTVTEGEKALLGVRTAAVGAVKEGRFRRQGLAVTTAILALFAVALALKVRRMARTRRDEAGPGVPGPPSS